MIGIRFGHQRWLPRLQNTTCRHLSNKEQLELANSPDMDVVYPSGSEHLTAQHFYQVGVQNWLERKPRPLTIAQMVLYGRHLSKQKILASANHVSEELTIRFAHRIRQMQLLPYRIMSHPALLNAYEQYVDSFEMLRRLGKVTTLQDNEELMRMGHNLLQKHTLVVTNIVRALREIVGNPHKEGDGKLLDDLVRSLMTSRLSRRVLVKQHALLTEAWRPNSNSSQIHNNMIGEVALDCRIVDVLNVVEAKSKKYLSAAYPGKSMPKVVVEGTKEDRAATFPYIWAHVEFAFGELLYNSLEACLRTGTSEPVVVTISASEDSVLVRVSDEGGGIKTEQLPQLWSFAKPDLGNFRAVSQNGLANHQFFNLLFPPEDVAGIVTRFSDDTDTEELAPETSNDHLGLGLALSKLYVEYWGGALEIHSIEGFGCDAVLRLSRTGSKKENLRF